MVSSGWIRNSAKSSEIEKARLPLTSDSLTVFAKIVSISVLERGIILVGIVICGDNDHKYMLECVTYNVISQH